MDQTLFISYRRADTGSRVSLLTRDLRGQFGPGAVFVDTADIRAADDWPVVLDEALRSCSVLAVAIGGRWLTEIDEFHRRRIDREDDWVHREVLFALENDRPIVPVFLDGQRPLQEGALPAPLRRLANKQGLEIRDTDWSVDVRRLCDRLGDFGFASTEKPIRYPSPMVDAPVATQAEIEEFLSRNPGWSVQWRPHPTDGSRQRRGIGTVFEFRSFLDAMHFMTTAAWGIDQLGHHPEWENIWRSVRVWITQLDIGGEITGNNFELAEYLGTVYEPYARAKNRRRG